MDEKKWDVFVYGDINVDIVIPNVEKFPLPGQEDMVDIMDTYVGGGAALFTLGLGKLGLKPVFDGAIGNDCYGSFILTELKKNNIDTSLLQISKENKTGISISFTNEKDRSFLTYMGTNKEIDIGKVNIENIKKARHIHITGYAGSSNHKEYFEFLQNVKKLEGTTISFDIGWDPTGEWSSKIYDLFPFIDVLFMNETEAMHYSRKNDAIDAIEDFSKYCKLVVVKLGRDGSAAFFNGIPYRANAHKVQAVDTTGAGDSFNAGFIYGFLKGESVENSLRFGNGCGALNVTAYGGNTNFPNEEVLLSFIEKQEER